MHARVTRSRTSVGCSMVASGTSSMRTSRAPCMTVAFMPGHGSSCRPPLGVPSGEPMFVSDAPTGDLAPWLQELNPEQRVAATHDGGHLLVLAGAGTGKTTTVCARVAWLVEQGVAAERILLLTFTRRAAREML